MASQSSQRSSPSAWVFLSSTFWDNTACAVKSCDVTLILLPSRETVGSIFFTVFGMMQQGIELITYQNTNKGTEVDIQIIKYLHLRVSWQTFLVAKMFSSHLTGVYFNAAGFICEVLCICLVFASLRGFQRYLCCLPY